MQQLGAPHRLAEASTLALLLRPLSAVGQSHVARARRRLNKAASLLFSNLPTPGSSALSSSHSSSSAVSPAALASAAAAVQAYCRTLTKELVDARGAPPLSGQVAEAVGDSVASVASSAKNRLERRVPELSVATLTAAHQNNAGLYNALLAIEGALRAVSQIIFSL